MTKTMETNEAMKMAQEYPAEVREHAEELYCVDGRTFEEISSLTGVAVRTLKDWARTRGWTEKKTKVREALGSIRMNRIMARAALMEKLLETLSAQDAFAVAALENIALKAAKSADAGRPSAKAAPGAGRRRVKNEKEAVEALEEALQLKMNAILSAPGELTAEVAKDVKQVLDLIAHLKSRCKAEEDEGKPKPRGLSKETVDEIRRKILGLNV